MVSLVKSQENMSAIAHRIKIMLIGIVIKNTEYLENVKDDYIILQIILNCMSLN